MPIISVCKGIQVQRKQKQVTEKANSLKNSRKAKEDLLKQGEAEKAKLEAQEQERKADFVKLAKRNNGAFSRNWLNSVVQQINWMRKWPSDRNWNRKSS